MSNQAEISLIDCSVSNYIWDLYNGKATKYELTITKEDFEAFFFRLIFNKAVELEYRSIFREKPTKKNLEKAYSISGSFVKKAAEEVMKYLSVFDDAAYALWDNDYRVISNPHERAAAKFIHDYDCNNKEAKIKNDIFNEKPEKAQQIIKYCVENLEEDFMSHDGNVTSIDFAVCEALYNKHSDIYYKNVVKKLKEEIKKLQDKYDKDHHMENKIIKNIAKQYWHLLNDNNENSFDYYDHEAMLYKLNQRGFISKENSEALLKRLRYTNQLQGADINIIPNRKSKRKVYKYDIELSIPAMLYFGFSDKVQLIPMANTLSRKMQVSMGKKCIYKNENGEEEFFYPKALDLNAKSIRTKSEINQSSLIKRPDSNINFALYGTSHWGQVRSGLITKSSNIASAVLSMGNFSVRMGQWFTDEYQKVKKSEVNKKLPRKQDDKVLYTIDFDHHKGQKNNIPTTKELDIIAQQFCDGKLVYQTTPHGIHVFVLSNRKGARITNKVKGYKIKPLNRELECDIRANGGYAVVSGNGYGPLKFRMSLEDFTTLCINVLSVDTFLSIMHNDQSYVYSHFSNHIFNKKDAIDIIKNNKAEGLVEFVYKHYRQFFAYILNKSINLSDELYIPYSEKLYKDFANAIDTAVVRRRIVKHNNSIKHKKYIATQDEIITNTEKAKRPNLITHKSNQERVNQGELRERNKINIASPQLPDINHVSVTDEYREGLRNTIIFTLGTWLNMNNVSKEEAMAYAHKLNETAPSKNRLKRKEITITINSAYSKVRGIDSNAFAMLNKCIRNSKTKETNFLKPYLTKQEVYQIVKGQDNDNAFRVKKDRKDRKYSHYDETISDITKAIKAIFYRDKKFRGATEKVSLIKSQEISLFIKKIREMKGLKGEVANISRTHTNKVLRIINRLTSLPEDDKKLILIDLLTKKFYNEYPSKKADYDLVGDLSDMANYHNNLEELSAEQKQLLNKYANKNLSIDTFIRKDIDSDSNESIETYTKLLKYTSIDDIIFLLSINIQSIQGKNGGILISVADKDLYNAFENYQNGKSYELYDIFKDYKDQSFVSINKYKEEIKRNRDHTKFGWFKENQLNNGIIDNSKSELVELDKPRFFMQIMTSNRNGVPPKFQDLALS